jgi:electron transfer flavoprotein alpha subunit
MANVLAFCETTDSTLRSSALSCITFAREAAKAHGGDVILLVIGKGLDAAAADAASYAGAVLAVDDDQLADYTAEAYAPIVARLAKEHGAAVVCATATSNGKDLLPRVAALLDAGMASDIASIESGDTFTRAILAGNAFSTVKVSSEVICVTARQANFDAAAPTGATGEIQSVDAGAVDALGAEVLRVESSRSERPDLNDADVVVSGGRGMGSGDNFKVLEELADLLGAAMGASRAATDAGMVPADWQVGQTGKIVAPKLYFAVAISGAIQHLAGMKSSKTIVAINKKGDEPIFEVADYGLVSTWEDALPALIEEIKKLKASQS